MGQLVRALELATVELVSQLFSQLSVSIPPTPPPLSKERVRSGLTEKQH